jgi:hypothetical protein
MTDEIEPPILTSELDYWDVTLKSGGRVTVRAHGVTERGGYYCFVALMAGTPAHEYELVRLPIADVQSYDGGWASPRDTGGSEGEKS